MRVEGGSGSLGDADVPKAVTDGVCECRAVESGDWDSRGQFALGANSDEEGDGEPQRSRGDSPPRYEEIGSDGQESAASMGPPSDSQPDAGVHSPSATNNDEVASVDEDEDDEDEPLVEPIQHMVMRGDTVRGLATRYGLDVSMLVLYLSTTPCP